MEIYERGNKEEESGGGSRLTDSMEIIRRLNRIKEKCKKGVLTIGAFDGVHKGHQEIIKYALNRARSIKRKGIVLTLYPHPLEFFGSKGQSITTLEEKIELIEDLGVDVLVVLKFNKKLVLLSPWQFIKKILLRFTPCEIVIGSNHTFGRGGKGRVSLLKKAGKIYNFKVTVINLKKVSGSYINSTGIRTLIRQGNVEKAKAQLGRYFSLTGKVVKGKGRGKILGFPTSNLKILPLKILPKNGVYSGYIWRTRKKHRGIVNVGYCPTFGEKLKHPRVEVFIPGFKDKLYGSTLKVEFMNRVRDERKFNSTEALSLQIKKDILKTEKEARWL